MNKKPPETGAFLLVQIKGITDSCVTDLPQKVFKMLNLDTQKLQNLNSHSKGLT